MDSGFDKIRRNNCTLLINKNFRNDNLEQALSAGEKTLQERYELTRVFSSDTSRVHKFTVRFAGVERGLYFKQYLCRSACDFIKHLVRASRAKRAFKATLILEKNGFEAPAVVAMGECKSGFFDRKNFLVTFEVENAKQIYQFIPDKLESFTKEQLQDKRELIRAFGRTVGRMHAAGIFHGDLKLVNVLARQEKNGWRLFFIDNERTKKFYRLPPWLRLKNLVQVNIPPRETLGRTDQMRFFKAYMSENPKIQDNWKRWGKKAIIKTNWRLEKRDKYFDCRHRAKDNRSRCDESA
ncbi:MAG: lipopolysaccharide kinase InaA family protein [Planctomycetota bacterium]